VSRIAIDASELLGKPTGAGRYLAQLLRSWDELPAAAAHEFVLCAPEPPAVTLPRLRVSVATAPGRGTWWQQAVLPRLVAHAGAQVLFAPAYAAPLRRPVPFVVAIHDVSFAARPEWFTWREGLRRRVLARLCARRAARVLTISTFSKREIVAHLGVHPDRVEVIYPGTTLLGPPPDTRVDRGAPLVLYVGSIFNRRHVPALIEGFTRLAARVPGARLELVGDNRTMPRLDIDAMARQAGDAVRVRSYVSDRDLADLYARASAFAFLSEYEGFALTPLEALAAGIPIVVLDTPVAREIYGSAAVYVGAPDPARIETALALALLDTATRTRILGTAPGVLARYSWEHCASRTLEVLLAAAAPPA
jgi:glycosyltransferase involved in cell wall biosynthesis